MNNIGRRILVTILALGLILPASIAVPEYSYAADDSDVAADPTYEATAGNESADASYAAESVDNGIDTAAETDTEQEETADDSQEDSASFNLGGIWIVPEVIGAARIPARDTSGNSLVAAWVTFDYYYSGNELCQDLNADDFTLQCKTPGDEWSDVPGNNIIVAGGSDYYIASFEAIIAARIPENTEQHVKKWRIVYKQGTADELIGETVVQGAVLEETEDVSAFGTDYCIDYDILQAPWSYEQYKKDNIPPIYIAHVRPDESIRLSDPALVRVGKTDPDPDNGVAADTDIAEESTHSIITSASISLPYDNGTVMGDELFETLETGLYLGDTEKDNGGIAGLVDTWQYMDEIGLWPAGTPIPDAEDLYNRLSSTVLVPDEDADDWLASIVGGTSVFWVSGVGTEERLAQGVSDYILVVVRDWEATGVLAHDWSDPEWIWTGDEESGYNAATATFRCGNNDSHVSTVTASVRKNENGSDTVYTATAAFNGKYYIETRTIGVDGEEDIDDYEKDYPAGSDPDKGSGSSDPGTVIPAPEKTSKTATINSGIVTKKAVRKAIQKSGGKATTLVLGKGVKKISKGALSRTGIRTVQIKSRKLTKKSVRGALKGSKVKTVKIKIGGKKINRKYIKKYKKYFTKKNAGRKVTVK